MPDSAVPRGLLRRALIVWLVLIAVEFCHGILRAIFLVPLVGDFRSRQIGVFTGSLLILAVACVFIRWLHAPDTKSRLLVGVLWLVLTVAFELSIGHFVLGRSWDDLGADYNISRGGFLPTGLVVLELSPVIAAQLRRLKGAMESAH